MRYKASVVNNLSEYAKQYAWRDWPTIFESLPSLKEKTILDLGCGIGDQAAEFVLRGARVIGVDTNEQLVKYARSRRIPNAEFRFCNLRESPNLDISANGIWCSFTAAYFPELPTFLTDWTRYLQPGGWVALTEIDDLFGHEPLSDRSKAVLNAYAKEALATGRYDFYMGRKLSKYIELAGLTIAKTLTLEDKELSFSGPACSDVVDAWRARFERMTLLRDFCGADFEFIRDDFLDCLTCTHHISNAKVYCCIATR